MELSWIRIYAKLIFQNKKKIRCFSLLRGQVKYIADFFLLVPVFQNCRCFYFFYLKKFSFLCSFNQNRAKFRIIFLFYGKHGNIFTTVVNYFEQTLRKYSIRALGKVLMIAKGCLESLTKNYPVFIFK